MPGIEMGDDLPREIPQYDIVLPSVIRARELLGIVARYSLEPDALLGITVEPVELPILPVVIKDDNIAFPLWGVDIDSGTRRITGPEGGYTTPSIPQFNVVKALAFNHDKELGPDEIAVRALLMSEKKIPRQVKEHVVNVRERMHKEAGIPKDIIEIDDAGRSIRENRYIFHSRPKLDRETG